MGFECSDYRTMCAHAYERAPHPYRHGRFTGAAGPGPITRRRAQPKRTALPRRRRRRRRRRVGWWVAARRSGGTAGRAERGRRSCLACNHPRRALALNAGRRAGFHTAAAGGRTQTPHCRARNRRKPVPAWARACVGRVLARIASACPRMRVRAYARVRALRCVALRCVALCCLACGCECTHVRACGCARCADETL